MSEEHVWIPLRDGLRLAATLYLPSDLPQPVVVEALPYRKDDVTQSAAPEYRRLRDEFDYAVCRIDLRGTGSSDGIATDEYPPQEQKDLCEAIAWLAAQEWCSGSVGMYGTSYSGFNSLQVAMERPPELKAICSIFASDDRYNDDVHYGGGIPRALDFVDYPLYMVALNALPPVPAIAGERWRETWRRRVEELEPWVLRWLQEDVESDYWRQGSLRPHYERIKAATMLVTGWADGYHNIAFRGFEALSCPKRLLAGPWAHTWTDTSRPGPRIDLVPEMVKWWDRWLRGRAQDPEPPIIVFARRSTRPAQDLDSYRGEFRYEPEWPPARGRDLTLALGEAAAPHGDVLTAEGHVGVTASIWCAGHLPWGQPYDQRPDDALSLTYDWGPLDDDLEILGYPRLEATITSDSPVAFLAAKLCDVFPDGTSALVARGVLNLTHRDSHARPEALEPGRAYEVSVVIDATSWVFEAGHRVRLSLSGSDWPSVWPPPRCARLAVDPAGSRLLVPVVHGPSPVSNRPELPPPRPQPGGDGSPVVWRVDDDLVAKERRVVVDHGSASELEIGGRSIERYFGTVAVSTDDPARAWADGRATYRLTWGDVTVETEARATLRSTADSFTVEIALDATEEGGAGWSRTWERTLPRRLS